MLPETLIKNKENPHILISAGEASGDIHGSNLVRAIRTRRPEITYSCMGGQELSKAGAEVIFDASRIAVVGLAEVLSHLGDILKARRIMQDEMINKKPALLILIDFPDFNLLLAAKAKKLGIPVLYYISPQVWAWRTKRMKKIGKLSSRIATILPFEQKFYQQHGYQVDYVGHPLLDTVYPQQSKEEFYRQHSIPNKNKCIGIIPGSRRKEISNLLPVFLEAAELFAQRHKQNYTFLLPKASTVSLQLLDENGLGAARQKLDIRVIDENRYALMSACDLAIAASGTVTLELAILETPTVVAYKVSPLTYRLGRILVRNINRFSLINLIADKDIVTELLQDEATAEKLFSAGSQILNSPDAYNKIIQEFKRVKSLLGDSGASDRTADIALDILDNEQKNRYS